MRITVAVGLLLGAMVGVAVADQPTTFELKQPEGVRQMSFTYYGEMVAAAPKAAPTPKTQATPKTQDCAACDAASCGCCDDCGCGSCCCESQWKLVNCCALQRRGINVGGWIDQGFTWNTDSPTSRSNHPVIYNDRSNDYQMNQLWVFAERAVNTGGCGWDIGGRIDLMYGTDGRFLTARGLEDQWNGTTGDYRMAMPQLYGEVGYNDLSVKVGHMLTPFGYERAQAPENFFYSHSLTHRIQPRTMTGFLAEYKLSDQLSFSAGMHNGVNVWDDNDYSIGFIMSTRWVSRSERTTAQFNYLFGQRDLDEAGTQGYDQNVYEFIITHKLNSRLTYVLDYTGHQITSSRAVAVPNLDRNSVSQYLIYDLNPCWSASTRLDMYYERSYRNGNWQTTAGGDFYSLAVGLNWKPNCNVIVRPELRWDWGDVPVYIDGSRYNQLLLAIDAIVKF